jgi:hypothetical protein
MNTSEKEEQPVLNQEVWRAWVQNGKLREEAASRKNKKLAAIALGIALLAAAGFHFIMSM